MKYINYIFLITVILCSDCTFISHDENLLTAYFIHPATDNQKFGLINQYGDEIIEPIYDYIEVSGNIAKVKQNDKYGFLNKNGKIIYPVELTSANNFKNGFALVSKEGNSLLIDTNGKIINDFGRDFDVIYDFHEGIAKFEKYIDEVDYNVGYIDTTGHILIEPIYDEGEYFISGMTKVIINGKAKLIDKNNKELYKPVYTYDSIIEMNSKNEKVEVKRVLIDGKMASLYPFKNGLALVWLNNSEYGWVNEKMNFVIKLKK